MFFENPLIGFLIALAISLLISNPIINIIKNIGAKQSIREDGPKDHLKKSGTPTIGGIIFISACIIALIITKNFTNNLIPILSMLGFGLIGFIDDFIKVVLKRNLGLTAKQKILGQILVSLLIGIFVYKNAGSTVSIPFIKTDINLGFIYIPFAMLVMIATANSANLTDGLDGLATTVTIVILLAFAAISKKVGYTNLLVFSLTLVGACIGFLRVNKNPAKIFMGDTGSMALGGAVVGLAMGLNMELLIPIICIIYFLESISVIMQVLYYKKTGKRIFLMAPFHHHLEAKGNSENKIVTIFGIVSLIASLFAYNLAI